MRGGALTDGTCLLVFDLPKNLSKAATKAPQLRRRLSRLLAGAADRTPVPLYRPLRAFARRVSKLHESQTLAGGEIGHDEPWGKGGWAETSCPLTPGLALFSRILQSPRTE